MRRACFILCWTAKEEMARTPPVRGRPVPAHSRGITRAQEPRKNGAQASRPVPIIPQVPGQTNAATIAPPAPQDGDPPEAATLAKRNKIEELLAQQQSMAKSTEQLLVWQSGQNEQTPRRFRTRLPRALTVSTLIFVVFLIFCIEFNYLHAIWKEWIIFC